MGVGEESESGVLDSSYYDYDGEYVVEQRNIWGDFQIMNRKVKISIILSLIIAVLAAIFVIFCDPIEKIKWSIEQSKIEDKVIYSRWNDKFGWSLCNTYNKSFTLEIFKAFNTVADTKAISDETNRHQSKVRVNLKKIVDDESELEKFEISPKELSEKYV